MISYNSPLDKFASEESRPSLILNNYSDSKLTVGRWTSTGELHMQVYYVMIDLCKMSLTVQKYRMHCL